VLISKTKLNRIHSIIPYLGMTPGCDYSFRYLVGPAETRLLRGLVSIRCRERHVPASGEYRLTKPSESRKERSAIAGSDGSGQLLAAEESPSLTREVGPELVYAPFNPPKHLRRLLILLP
jgi:hypothetical protein